MAEKTRVKGMGADGVVAEKRRHRRTVIIGAVVGVAFLAFGTAAFATPAGDLLLADLVANSLKSLTQGIELIEQAEKQAKVVKDAADMAQRVANTASALQDLNAKRIGDRLQTDLVAAYPELGSVYGMGRGLGHEQRLVDWSITYCLADGMQETQITDALTGQTISRREWCRRFKASGDGRMLSTAYSQLAGAPVDAALSALEAQRRRLLYEEDLYQFRLCLQRNVAFCAARACAEGPAAWSNATRVARVPCQRVPTPGQPPPSPTHADTTPCRNPFPLNLGGNAEEQDRLRKEVCQSEMQAAQLGDMTMRMEGEQAQSRGRQLAQLGLLIDDARQKADAAAARERQAQASVAGVKQLEQQLSAGVKINAPTHVNGSPKDKAMHLEAQ